MLNSGAAGNAAGSGAPHQGADAALERIGRVLAVVESCLCEAFPSDFYRRCAFAAFAVRRLLQEDALDPVMVGGHFGALVVTPDQRKLAIQGFKPGPERFPHFWIEAAGRLVDLGPHLLAFGSDYPVLGMPALAWDLSMLMPAAFRYEVLHRFPADNKISRLSAVQEQCEMFVAQCEARDASDAESSLLSTWIATNSAAMLAAAERNDPWAIGARRFEQMVQFQPLPF